MLNFEVNSAEAMNSAQEPLTEYQQSQLFEVTVTGDEETGYTANRTVTEISAAVNAGCPVVCRKGGLILPLVKMVEDNIAEFAFVESNTFKSVIITDTTVSYCEYASKLDDPQQYFQISDAGEISLNDNYRSSANITPSNYRGNGLELDLPEMLVIPDMIGDTVVRFLSPGMFYGNKRVKGIKLPSTVTEIPDTFCQRATNLQTVTGTERIKKYWI